LEEIRNAYTILTAKSQENKLILLLVIFDTNTNGSDRIHNPLDTKIHLKTQNRQLPKLRVHLTIHRSVDVT